MKERLQRAAEILLKMPSCALTGAGVSTESGIPDFRSDTGYYQAMDPMAALSRETLMGDPKRFYQEGYRILTDLEGKEPNPAHIALARLEELGVLEGLVTQNIDNLHTAAGSQKVFEVHGHTRTVHCISCGNVESFRDYREKVSGGEIPPRCSRCGGVLRPDVVMFGDAMPETFEKAYRLAERMGAMLVVGSSLTVAPVSYLPGLVEHLIIVNREPTPYDKRAEVIFREDAGVVLPALVKTIEGMKR